MDEHPPGRCLIPYCCPACDDDFFETTCPCDDEECDAQSCSRVDAPFFGPNFPHYIGHCGRSECMPHTCPNYAVCGSEVPPYAMPKGLCMHCDMVLDAVIIRSEIFECDLCYETVDTKALMAGCTHGFCVDCFTRCGFNPFNQQKATRVYNQCPMCRAPNEAAPSISEQSIQFFPPLPANDESRI